jgi:hypothetical protein
VAIRVTPEQFDKILAERFGTPTIETAKWRTMQRAIETGKIQRGELGLSGVGKSIQRELGGMEVDISVIRVGGPFDKGPFILLPPD